MCPMASLSRRLAELVYAQEQEWIGGLLGNLNAGQSARWGYTPGSFDRLPEATRQHYQEQAQRILGVVSEWLGWGGE